ncbi:MAG TPA: tetratricopeptide repeat-containing glycosyltransferase family protein [Chthoniobacter sp.]|nr:tetratricopeptide repeat-containing glycosyltransferase family protein [Chthoniobacter sp.]
MPQITIEQALQLAAQHHNGGNIEAAESMCRQVLAVVPDHRDALHLLGLNALSTGRYNEALQWFTKAASQFPPFASYQCDVGVVHRFLGQPEEAARCFEQALATDPGHAVAWSNLCDTLMQLGRVDDAIASGLRAVAAQPPLAEAHSNLGNALREKRRLDEALAHFQQAMAINPNLADVHKNLACTYIEMDRWDDAIASCDRAIALQPGFGKAYLNRGTACMGKCDIAEAEQSFRRVIECPDDHADGHWNLSIALLLSGRYEEGWREFEWRRMASVQGILGAYLQGTDKPRWDGSPAEGQTILIYAEQGLGDVIQFSRYVPFVWEQGLAQRVVFLCPPSLAELLQQSGEWNAEIVAYRGRDETVLPDFDQHVALLSLPLALGKFEPWAPPAPYLHTDPAKRATWRERLGPAARKKVGLVWKGNPTHVDDRRRSIDPRRLLPLFQVPGVDRYSLQLDWSDGRAANEAPEGLIDLTDHIADFTDTAAFMAELDLIISVDTATAHLAGALGRPVWLLLPFSPDWRWGLGSEATPWYSTMRLFRQKSTGAWEEVVQRVTAELSNL